jgi:hypothetical protein
VIVTHLVAWHRLATPDAVSLRAASHVRHNVEMASTPLWVPLVVAGVGVLGTLSAVFFTQAWAAKLEGQRWQREHEWLIETVKREAYAEFLRSISASYAQAESEAEYHAQAKSAAEHHETDNSERKSPLTDRSAAEPPLSHKPEDANLRAATAAIQLLANPVISREVTRLSDRVIAAHEKFRKGDSSDVADVNRRRENIIIPLFKDDLGI